MSGIGKRQKFDTGTDKRLKRLCSIAENNQPSFKHLAEIFQSGKFGDHPLPALIIFDGQQSIEPDQAGFLQSRKWSAKPVLGDVVFEINPYRGVQPSLLRQI